MSKTALSIPEPYSSAHRFASYHKDQILAAKLVGCFYCYSIYPPSEIKEWIDRGNTALCPKCGIDSVVYEVKNVTIELTPEYLKKMGEYWFAMAEVTPEEMKKSRG